MNNTIKFESQIYNLGDSFFNKKFNIPIYQRLYVWGESQVNTLIEDLISAYIHNKDKIYYLGGIVVVKNNDIYDLIDGQQRFTTLKILREILEDEELILRFSVRENVWEEFKADKSDNVDIRRMINAKKLLRIGLDKEYENKEKEEVKKIKIDKKLFLDYLKEQVSLVVTKVPLNTDLNKLFELINGRGEQLLQHEILKAKILSHIDEKDKYGKIWDICANMDENIEINIKNILFKEDKNITWKDYFETYKNSDIQIILKNLKVSNNTKTKNSIFKIINQNNKTEVNQDGFISEDENEGIQYLSIISFPMFLLYTLVYYDKDFMSKIDKKIEFKDKNLIKIFETTLLETINQEQAEKFFNKLFEFRILFDKWVIKTKKVIGDSSNNSEHKIIIINKIKSDKSITKTIKDLENSRDLSLLQSMLYYSHTRNTQDWIIPFLVNIRDDIKNNVDLLKNIDNILYSQIKTSDTVLQRAINFDIENKIIHCESILEYLRNNPEDDYHYFSHYWFYKMDWIIWDLKEKKENDFKFTARNSIEHISSQTHDEENKIENRVSDKYKHSFGNLCLISVSQNSSFSNKGFKEKKGEFEEKKIQNLKMSLIYEYDKWTDDECQKHLKLCMESIEKYYKELQK